MRLVAIASVFAIALTAAGCTNEDKSDNRPDEGTTQLSAKEFCEELDAAQERERLKDLQKDVAAIQEAGIVRKDVPSEVREGFELWAGIVKIVFEKRAIAQVEEDVSELESLQLKAYHDWVDQNW